MNLKRIAALIVASLLLVIALPTLAQAIPVRNLVVLDAGENFVTIGARAFSPPTADGCGATYAMAVYRGGTRYRFRQGKLNVCRFEGPGSWTYGIIAGRFNVSDLPIGNYTVCAVAVQSVNGVPSRHGICRDRRI